MRLSVSLWRNLNAKHWNRRIWEIGYRGPLLPQLKATGKPDRPISRSAIDSLQARLQLEYNVMKCLATPYLTKEKESAYISVHGDFEQQLENVKREADYKRMPGEPKVVTGYKSLDRPVANIGNLLHKHRSVEDSMKELICRQRWD